MLLKGLSHQIRSARKKRYGWILCS